MPVPATHVTHLACALCNKNFAPGEIHPVCDCGGPLLVRYDLARIRETWDRKQLLAAPHTMWRYRPVLPVTQPSSIISLGEGMTPLSRIARAGARLGAANLWLKDEGRNPTGSFKARGLSCAVSMCRELGVKKVAIRSAGSAASALAAYAAAAGIEAYVFMPRDVARSNYIECQAYGAHVTLVDGLSSRKDVEGWFDVGTLGELYRIEGDKTMGYETAEQLGWRVPDAILYPAGGGVRLLGIRKAFDELEQLGWIGPKRPKIIAVQADDEQIDAGIRLARDEGIFVAPGAAACLPALEKLLRSGILKEEEQIVIYNTGSGLKYLETYAARFPPPSAGEQDKLGGLITPR